MRKSRPSWLLDGRWPSKPLPVENSSPPRKPSERSISSRCARKWPSATWKPRQRSSPPQLPFRCDADTDSRGDAESVSMKESCPLQVAHDASASPSPPRLRVNPLGYDQPADG